MFAIQRDQSTGSILSLVKLLSREQKLGGSGGGEVKERSCELIYRLCHRLLFIVVVMIPVDETEGNQHQPV